MEMDYETINLQVRDFISPECTCNLVDAAQNLASWFGKKTEFIWETLSMSNMFKVLHIMVI